MRAFLVLVWLVAWSSTYAMGQAGSDQRIDVYVQPYYSSEGPVVRVGPLSDRLESAEPEVLRGVAAEIEASEQSVRPIVMHVLAIRMYDAGLKDEAVYWFYNAQFHARLFRAVLAEKPRPQIGAPDFEISQAHNAFHQLAGTWINGYAFGNSETFRETLERVRTTNQRLPDFEKAFPSIAFLDRREWGVARNKVDKGLAELIQYTVDHEEEIKAQRKANGIEGKY